MWAQSNILSVLLSITNTRYLLLSYASFKHYIFSYVLQCKPFKMMNTPPPPPAIYRFFFTLPVYPLPFKWACRQFNVSVNKAIMSEAWGTSLSFQGATGAFLLKQVKQVKQVYSSTSILLGLKLIVFSRRHGSHIGVPKHWKGGHVGVQNNLVGVRSFLCNHNFFSNKTCMAAGHLSENFLMDFAKRFLTFLLLCKTVRH